MQLIPFLAAPALVLALTVTAPMPAHAAGSGSAVVSAADLATLDACLASAVAEDRSPDTCIGQISSPCLDAPDAASTAAMVGCLGREAEAWDQVLNREYVVAMRNPERRVRTALQQAQRAWLTSRERTCGLWGALEATGQTGTMGRLEGASCWSDETARRALLLFNWNRNVG
jgi:uncharacterized protein YecT (DUF1311 family)